ncbi:hypothetical protein CYMTET_9371, partial [Cymbomonas tetramitiformis]
VPSPGAISPGASATQASAATLTWVLRSALVAGARVCGVTLPGPLISSPKSLDGARSPCTRCAPPLGTISMACLVGQLRVTRPETAAIYPAASWRPAHLLSEEPQLRPVAVHTLRATPRHHEYGVPGGAAARHAARDSGHLSGCLVAAPSFGLNTTMRPPDLLPRMLREPPRLLRLVGAEPRMPRAPRFLLASRDRCICLRFLARRREGRAHSVGGAFAVPVCGIRACSLTISEFEEGRNTCKGICDLILLACNALNPKVALGELILEPPRLFGA